MGEMTHKIEVDRLNALIDKTAQHWLALQSKHPIAWEGAIDEAMAAACDRIEALEAEVAGLREALQAVVTSRDENCHKRETFKTGGAYGEYWSPNASMVESSAIAQARAALKDTRHD